MPDSIGAARALRAFCAILYGLAGAAAQYSWEDIAAAGGDDQWALSTEVGYVDGAFAVNTCASGAYGACFNESNPPPFHEPLQSLGPGQIRVTYDLLTTSISTFRGGVPMEMLFTLCYSTEAATNRAWRSKNKAFPELTTNCPFEMGVIAWPPGITDLDDITPDQQAQLSGSFVFTMTQLDDIPAATLFFMMWVECTNGETCAYTSTEAPTSVQPALYVETSRYDPVTRELMGVSIALGVIGPIVFLAYFFVDRAHFARHNRPLAIK